MSAEKQAISLTLDFGKYRGTEIEDVPLSYMIFLAGYRMLGARRQKSTLDACEWIRLNKKECRTYAENFLAGKCWHCGTKLVPVGSSRLNGAAHDDWDGRYLHKRCWRDLNAPECSAP